MKYEKIILDLIQEYLDKNRTFSARKIIPLINSRFAKSGININSNGIKVILKNLIEKNIIVEGSKLTKEDVLSNVNRKTIYEFILKNPGVYFYQVVKKLNLTIPVVEWHLNILSKFSYIRKVKLDTHEIYFRSNFNNENDELIYFISKDKCKKIINHIKRKLEGITKTQLSKDLGMHPNTISKYINKLKGFNLISSKNLINKTLYFLNDRKFNEINQY